jgi:heterodisulfide reductase subunit A
MSDTAKPRIGVIVCDCGKEIAGKLDTRALTQHASTLSGVVYATREAYPCSKDSRYRLAQAIAAEKIERVLVAGCTPRRVNKLFEGTLRSAGLEPGYLDVRNIREHCAYVHPQDPQIALQKAANLIEMGVARLCELAPPHLYSGPVERTALVIGSSISGLTAAITLARRGIPVTLVEHAATMGGSLYKLQEGATGLIDESVQVISGLDHVQILLNAAISNVTGQPGNYRVEIIQGGVKRTQRFGAIVVATGARQQDLDGGHWYDRSRVKTQIEYSAELETASYSQQGLDLKDVVMILYEDEDQGGAGRHAQLGHLRGRHSTLNCLTSIHQAITTKELNPQARLTILFRELYLGALGDRGEEVFLKAKELGVTFFRYQQGLPPVIGEAAVEMHDQLTGDTIRIPYDRIVLAMPLVPQENADSLAVLLRLPQDEAGFLVKPRMRLRPGHYADDGVFVLGGAHDPVDTSEALFQAYLTSARVLRFLDQERIEIEAPTASIQPQLCTGCGNCVQVCPMAAITLEKRDQILSLSEVDALRCVGCGNCVVVCPVKAISMPGWNDAAILAQISAALSPAQKQPASQRARVIVLACEWSAFAAADIAGTRRISYPPEVRIIRMNCSARFDPNHILWAFLSGSDGVFLGTCYPGECHYGTGNLYAKERVEVLKKQLAEHGVDPRRLRLEFFAGDEGFHFAQAITNFVEELTLEEHG